MNYNPLLNTDSYKVSMWKQNPPGSKFISSYIESRGGRYAKTVYFGLQMFIDEYLMKPFTMGDINYAEKRWTAHGLPFNREGFEYILRVHNGYFPVRIQGLDEGTVIPSHNALVQIVNTDPHCAWVTTYLETALVRAIWYPTTVASNSFACKNIILKFLDETGTPNTADFKLHDFGARGVSSLESAGIGGVAHLTSFMGTDTFIGCEYATEYYLADMAGFSIPASEHSTITSWGGPEHEIEAFENMLDQFGGEGKIVACVSDSYNIWQSVEKWKYLEPLIKAKGMTLVIRPDSGDPVEVVGKLIDLLMTHFGFTTNDKGFDVLPDHIRVIQGDGITIDSMEKILEQMKRSRQSADNIAFGMGSGTLQQFDRDTMRFAMKASAIDRGDGWEDVYKDPITAPGKKSKRGRLETRKTDFGTWETIREEYDIDTTHMKYGNKLKTRYLKVANFFPSTPNRTTFEEIRTRVEEGRNE